MYWRFDAAGKLGRWMDGSWIHNNEWLEPQDGALGTVFNEWLNMVHVKRMSCTYERVDLYHLRFIQWPFDDFNPPPAFFVHIHIYNRFKAPSMSQCVNLLLCFCVVV